jgi:hypothetical protein
MYKEKKLHEEHAFLDSIKMYSDAIESISNSKDKFIFPNACEEHARILMSHIFRTANVYVKIFTGNLNDPAPNDSAPGVTYLEELELFLKRGGHLQVVLCQYPSEKSNVLQLIEKYELQFPNNISIGVANSQSIEITKTYNSGELYYFCTADSRMFRKEHDIKYCLAQGSFNQYEEVLSLEKNFSVLFFNSERLVLGKIEKCTPTIFFLPKKRPSFLQRIFG